jgi:FemAB-related protein (PEP-CTERM system-associated)
LYGAEKSQRVKLTLVIASARDTVASWAATSLQSRRSVERTIQVTPFEGTSGEWDDFVLAASGSTFCHLVGWREIIADVFGHECSYTVAKDVDGRWCGLLPLVRIRSRLLGHYLVSMPFLNYGGPLGTREAQFQLTQQAATAASESAVDLLELRSRQAVPCDLSVSHRKVTVIQQLAETVDTHWGEVIPASRRRQIRRAQKQEMQARFGPDQLEPFYEVFTRNMRDLGTPVLPFRWFESIHRVFGKRVVFGAVYSREQPLAAACGFLWRDEFELTWVSSLREHNRNYPNMLLYWSFMQRMIERDIRVFNFGRCTPGGSTHRFKRQWGGVDIPLPWPQWSPLGVTAPPSPDRPLLRFASATWQRLPLAVANRLGPHLARVLP